MKRRVSENFVRTFGQFQFQKILLLQDNFSFVRCVATESKISFQTGEGFWVWLHRPDLATAFGKGGGDDAGAGANIYDKIALFDVSVAN